MNIGSQFGRMSYATHMLFYPTAFVLYVFAYKPYAKSKAKAKDEQDWNDMPALRKVDRDIFNPFTPIPFHNNRELKYAFAHINMQGFVNKNHINVKTYPWKQYHNAYAEDADTEYLFNWTSTSSYNH